MADTPSSLHERARHFRELASAITDEATCGVLARMAREFDERADALDAGAKPEPRPRAE